MAIGAGTADYPDFAAIVVCVPVLSCSPLLLPTSKRLNKLFYGNYAIFCEINPALL
jgi:hypothetical protein